jgi:hypothetical protein
MTASSTTRASAGVILRIGQKPKPTCRIVLQLVSEMVFLFGDRVMVRRDRRRLAAHSRQIAMYVCHVALSISVDDIAASFGRERSTVAHACHLVEDRRDDPAYEDFVSAVERMVTAIFGDADEG